MTADVDKRGNADVKQSVGYLFDGEYHGVFATQDLRGIKGGKLQNVTITSGNNTQIVKAANSGAENTYKLTQSGKQIKVKVYHTTKYGNEFDVTYRYKLYGVVTNYLDTAEVNWKIIGEGWDVPLKNVKIRINLPASKISRLQAWIHSDSSGYTTVDKKNGNVRITMAEDKPNDFVGAHLLFPTLVTPQNTNLVKKNHLKKEQAFEAKLAQKTNNQKEHRNLFFLIATVVSGLIGLLMVGVNVHWLLTHRFKNYPRPTPIDHSFEIPSVSPAVAEAIWSRKKANTDALSAEMLVLANRKEVGFETVDGKRSKKKTIKITVLKKGIMVFLDSCVRIIGNGKSVTLEQIKRYANNDTDDEILSWFEDWQDGIEKKVSPYKDNSNIEFRNRLCRITLIAFGFMVVSAFLAAQFAVTAVIITLVIGLLITLVLGIWLFRIWRVDSIYNQKGLELENQIKGFRKMLNDIGHFNTAEIGDLLLWEEILPYATAFGLAEKVANKLKVDFGNQLNESVPFYGYYYAGYGAVLNASISSSLGQVMASATAANASVIGSSGGFSGGSSGGFGGGSGGGAF
ncbi:hypothetical protein IV79_GL000444 [Pediococcus claussenii]|nr:hypothetical protein IV79_GL000444 [Pediococcus claussenii]